MSGGGCEAVCAEDHQPGHPGVPALPHPDQRQHHTEIPAAAQLCRLPDGNGMLWFPGLMTQPHCMCLLMSVSKHPCEYI